jgi:hypothetical protein
MALHKVGAIGWFDAVHRQIESCIVLCLFRCDVYIQPNLVRTTTNSL